MNDRGSVLPAVRREVKRIPLATGLLFHCKADEMMAKVKYTLRPCTVSHELGEP